MDSEQIDDEKSGSDMFKWDDSATRLMLNFYNDAIKNFGKTSHFKTKNQLWIQIIEEINKYGYNVTPKQAQNRLVTLERAFKKRQKDDNRKNYPPASALYDDEIKEIAERKKEIQSLQSSIFIDNDFENIDSSSLDVIATSSRSIMDINRWDPSCTKMLLNAFLKTVANPSKMRSFGTKKNMWQNIAEKINSQGYQFTARQTRNRIGTLMRAYKKYMEKKRCGVRAFFMFEKEMQEVIKHRLVMPDRDEMDSDKYYDEDEFEGFENEFEVNFIDIDVTDNINNIPMESETTNTEEIQSFTLSEKPLTNAPQSSTNHESYSHSYAVLNELRLLRRSQSEFHHKLFKLEEEKLDLMRQNNILLKVLIDKTANKS